MFESISFCLSLYSVFWDKPPAVIISLDDNTKFAGEIICDQQNPAKICFSHELSFHESHTLSLYRYNKTPDQCCESSDGQVRDQLLMINGLIIDDVDVRHLIWCSSQFVPIYPEPWKSQQIDLGHDLEETIVGESILGHNGTWSLNFTSPFYQFLFDDMDK